MGAVKGKLVVETSLEELLEGVWDAISTGKHKISKNELVALNLILDALEDRGLLENRHRDRVGFLAANWPSRLISWVESGLRDPNHDETPIEFENRDSTPEENADKVERWVKKLDAIGRAMQRRWLE